MTQDNNYGYRAGDEVTWSDPDQGLCSRTLVIREIKYDLDEGTFLLVDTDGDVLEGFIHELSSKE